MITPFPQPGQSAPPPPSPQSGEYQPGPPSSGPSQYGPAPYDAAPYGHPQYGATPYGHPPYGPHPFDPARFGVPPAPMPRPAPWYRREGAVSRVLAAAGAAVTLIGLAMLLVLAAQYGYLGPLTRVVGGAVLSAALVVAGQHVHRRPGGGIAGAALTATGIAGSYLVILAAGPYYGWLPPVAGLGLAFGVAATGMAIALRWHSQALAAGVLGGVALLAPALTGGPTLVLLVYLTLLATAALPITGLHDWPFVTAARVVPLTFALIAAAATDTDGALLLVVAAACAVLALGGGLAGEIRHPGSFVSAMSVVVGALPAVVVAGAAPRAGTALTFGALALISAAVAVTTPGTASPRENATGSGTARRGEGFRGAAMFAAVIEAAAVVIDVTPEDVWLPSFLLLTLGLIALAITLGSRGIGFAAGALAMLTLPLFYLATGPMMLLSPRGVASIANPGVLTSVMIVLAGALGLGWWGRLRDDGRVVLAAIIAAGHAVGAGAIIGGSAVAGETGYLAGHAAATAVIAVIGGGLLLISIRPDAARWARPAGLAILALAVGKLVMFDLAALDPVWRMLAFLVVGLLLLGAATRFGRLSAEPAADGPSNTETTDPSLAVR